MTTTTDAPLIDGWAVYKDRYGWRQGVVEAVAVAREYALDPGKVCCILLRDLARPDQSPAFLLGNWPYGRSIRVSRAGISQETH